MGGGGGGRGWGGGDYKFTENHKVCVLFKQKPFEMNP